MPLIQAIKQCEILKWCSVTEGKSQSTKIKCMKINLSGFVLGQSVKKDGANILRVTVLILLDKQKNLVPKE
jgi:hypothetical protein